METSNEDNDTSKTDASGLNGTHNFADHTEQENHVENDVIYVNGRHINVDEKEEPDVIISQEPGVEGVPDGGWGWVIVASSFLVHALMGGYERANGIVYLQLRDKFGRSATETAWVLSIFATLRLAMGPLASALCNRFSIRFVVMLGSAICTFGVFISAFMPSLYPLYVTYGVLGGLGRSLTYTCSLIIVGYYFDKRRGLAVGISTSGVGIGCFVFPPLIELMFNHYGFRGTFLILSAVTSNFFVCGAMFRPLELQQRLIKYNRRQKLRKERGETYVEQLLPSSKNPHLKLLENQEAARLASSMDITAELKIQATTQSIFKRKMSNVKLAMLGKPRKESLKPKSSKPILDISLMKNFGFTALCAQLFLYTLAFNLTFVFLPALAKEKGISQLDGSLLVSILGICDGISRLVMSTVLDLKKVKPYRLIVYNAVMFFNAIACVLLPTMRQFWQFALMSALFGVFSGIYISQKSVVIVDVLGVENLSSSFGLLLFFQGLSALIGPVVGGVFKDRLGTYDMAFYFGSIGIVLGGFMMVAGNIWIHREKRRKRAEQNPQDN